MEGSRPADAPAALDLTVLPPLDDLLTRLVDQLAAWMPAQRWFAHKGAQGLRISVGGWAPLHLAADHLVLATVLTAEAEGQFLAHYQCPLVLRRPEGAAAEPGAEIGVLAVPGGPIRVDDATGDPQGRTALLGSLLRGGGAAGPGLRMTARPSLTGPAGERRGVRTRLLQGEQSNTSMIVEADGSAPLIMKLFRVLQDGPNPDVVLQSALHGGGSTQVPAAAGSILIATADLRTHALFAQEFLPGVEDGWRTTVELARTGTDFTAGAEQLGAAVARVHADLAAALGTVRSSDEVVAALIDQMQERLDQIAGQLPAVAAHRESLQALLEAAYEVDWPPMQRIHGDLHLGQVLAVPNRGWVLLDFEGEPLRPLEQRSRPDSPLRDVAGMLRSLDYAAGAVAHSDGVYAGAWAQAAREEFLAGYLSQSGLATGAADATEVLVAAFEADKAVYEALYESRNRPDWLAIPLRAIERIAAGGPAAGTPPVRAPTAGSPALGASAGDAVTEAEAEASGGSAG